MVTKILKAKEIYNKYFACKFENEEQIKKAVFEAFKHIFFEIEYLIKQRKAKSDAACMSIVKEQQKKMDALNRIAVKNKGCSIFVEDALFKYMWREKEDDQQNQN